MVETKLARISQISEQNPRYVFNSLAHLIDKEMLLSCYRDMDPDKAAGRDGITKEKYEEHLDANLDLLLYRMKHNIWRPQPARLVEIPKDDGKSVRPIAIYCFEDKIVQEAIRRILEAIYLPIFYSNMHGFMPQRSCQGALRELTHMIEDHPTNVILDADITGYFNNLQHDWIMKLLRGRISDERFLNLVLLVLRTGIMRDFVFEATENGAGQGSVCSPIIANIYMHYVVNWWFHERVLPRAKGYMALVIYADDFVGGASRS